MKNKIKRFREFLKPKEIVWHPLFASIKPSNKNVDAEEPKKIVTDIKEDVGEFKPRHLTDKFRDNSLQELHHHLSHIYSSDVHPDHHELKTKLNNHYTNFEHLAHRHPSLHYYTSDGSEDINRAMYKNDEAHLQYFGHHIDSIRNSLREKQAPHDFTVYTGINRSPERYKDGHHPIGVQFRAFTSTSIRHDIARSFSDGDHQSDYLYHYHPETGKYTALSKKTLKFYKDYHEAYRNDDNDTATKLRKSRDFEDYMEARKKHGDIVKFRHVLKIHVPKGSIGGYIGEHSRFPKEQEFLLHDNAKILVHPSPTVIRDFPDNYDRSVHPEEPHEFRTVTWHARLVHDGVKNV